MPTSHCPEARWQDNPGAAATPSRAPVMRGDRAAISYADGHTGGGKGIPRALMRNTTITRPPRSIATAFPSATRGRCVYERDRRFESVSLQRGVDKPSVPQPPLSRPPNRAASSLKRQSCAFVGRPTSGRCEPIPAIERGQSKPPDSDARGRHTSVGDNGRAHNTLVIRTHSWPSLTHCSLTIVRRAVSRYPSRS